MWFCLDKQNPLLSNYVELGIVFCFSCNEPSKIYFMGPKIFKKMLFDRTRYKKHQNTWFCLDSLQPEPTPIKLRRLSTQLGYILLFSATNEKGFLNTLPFSPIRPPPVCLPLLLCHLFLYLGEKRDEKTAQASTAAKST
jgi:hypothetical protein